MYYLGNLEIFDEHRYGLDGTNSPGIEYHWMVVWCSAIDDTRDDPPDLWVRNVIGRSADIGAFHRHNILRADHYAAPLAHIENGETIVRHPSYLRPQLIEVDILPGGECVGYPTGSFWLKIFQRKWRNILAKRRERINHFKCLRNMMDRELGIKPITCVSW